MKFSYYNPFIAKRIGEVEFIESEDFVYLKKIAIHDDYDLTDVEWFIKFCNSVKGTYDKGIKLDNTKVFIKEVVDPKIDKLEEELEKLKFIKRNANKLIIELKGDK